MVIIVGEYYKTRSGRKAYIAAKLHTPFKINTKYPYVGFIDHKEKQCDAWTHNWTVDGSFTSIEHANDLIEEWKEPRKATVYMYELKNGEVLVSETIYDADRFPMIAEVVITEGDGMTD